MLGVLDSVRIEVFFNDVIIPKLDSFTLNVVHDAKIGQIYLSYTPALADGIGKSLTMCPLSCVRLCCLLCDVRCLGHSNRFVTVVVAPRCCFLTMIIC